MGNLSYNPHRPQMLGQEWVPIKAEPYDLDTDVERGYTFTLPTATTVVSGAMFMDDVPETVTQRRLVLAVYEEGTEHLTGPLQRVVIPPSSGIAMTTGSPANVGWQGPAGSSGATLLSTPHSYSYVFFEGNVDIHVWFDTASFSAQLDGKRIYAVNILYCLVGQPPLGIEPDGTIISSVTGNFQGYPFPTSTEVAAFLIPSGPALGFGFIDTFPLGNVPYLYTTINDTSAVAAFPRRYQDLQGFQHTVAPKSNFRIRALAANGLSINDTPLHYLTYCALEVIYGEETRLLFGCSGRTDFDTSQNYEPLAGQPAPILLRRPDTFALGRTLDPGNYTVTVSEGNVSPLAAFGDQYVNKALRQYYDIPTHRGVEVTTNVAEGRYPVRREIDVLPQATLHTASGVVTGVHTYGDQEIGQVSHGVDVTQDVVQLSGGAAVQYPQVRFYARRWGNTNQPLTLFATGIPAWTVVVTPEEFDALPEIVDGWREVTLRFSSPPTFDNTGGNLEWRWGSEFLDVGARWEILGARSRGRDTGVYTTDPATYGGAGANMINIPLNTDPKCDAVLIFSQDPPTVTGVGVSAETLQLEGISQECAVDPVCVPTDVDYHVITWSAPAGTSVYEDFEDATLSISVVSGGSAAWFRSSAQAHDGTWSYESGNVADNQATRFTVTVPAGAQTLSFWYRTSTELGFDFFSVFRDSEAVAAVSASGENDWTFAEISVAGFSTVMFEFDKDTILSGGSDTVWVDDILFGYGYTLEMQRSDDVDPEWQTIMRTGDVLVTSFNDYEARVGVTSSYRMRVVNDLSFVGSWSTTAQGLLPAPGVGGAGDGSSVLIFTSNERQDGSAVLAYVMSWETNVSEDITFPESGDVQLQQMYNRDFVTAFRPLERGGEQFSRTIIVQNAAVLTGRMRDGFTSLRDLAWDTLSYVCVRNELGDRWLASVQVPSGKILRNRRLYLAQINVVEVTDTPSAVDPGVVS